jgi:hypothetical protein
MCGRHRVDMPIVVRQPGSATTDMAAPLEDLLPSGGAPVLAPALAPHRALALDAFRLRRTLHDHSRDADTWGEPAFAREVEVVRGQLAPIRSRRGLAASFAREACQTGGLDGSRSSVPLRPLRVAYAVRWLELGDGVARAGWIELVTDPG